MATIVQEIHLEDIGTKFRVTIQEGTVVVDVTGATTMDFVFRKPDGTKLTVAGVLVTPASGIVSYDTVSGDLNQTGRWKLQIVMVLPGGSWKTDISEFIVHPNL